MNKKLLLGLGSTLILSVPILAATSCGDNSPSASGYRLEKNTDATKITLKIEGSNLSTEEQDWSIKYTDASGTGDSVNDWVIDKTKSNSNSVYFDALKDNTKGKNFEFICKNKIMILNFATPFAPTSISAVNAQSYIKGYQGTTENPQNEAIVTFTDPSSLTINFEFKNDNQPSTSNYMKLTLPAQLGNVFENYQGYNPKTKISWSLKDANSNFKIENNTLLSTTAIDPATMPNVVLVGTISMSGWEDKFEINVKFSNQVNDIRIDTISQKVNQDKIALTISGSNLPTDQTKWTFKEGNTTSTEWTLSTSQTPSSTQVVFEATYANVMGKTFTIEGQGTEITASKEVTINTSTITNIDPQITEEGNLTLTVSGTNLSSDKSLYQFNFVSPAPLDAAAQNPSIDVNLIDLVWTNDSQIIFTIQKGTKDNCLTKGLYGATFNLQIKNQTPTTEFTFADYQAPTAIVKDQFFTNVFEGQTDADINTAVTQEKITGSGLNYVITTSTQDKKFVKISLKKSDGSTNIFDFLQGQKGFTTSGNSTELTWSIPTDQTSNWTYDAQTSELKNNQELTTDSNLQITVTGTITDTITSRAKTFTLSLTLVLFDPTTILNEPTISWVNDSQDKGKKIKVTFTGKGLSTNQSDWTIQPTDTTSTTPSWTIDPSSTATSVSFTIDYNKDTLGKTYTFSVAGIQGSKNVAIPVSAITKIDPTINQNGDLILTFTGTNLSANLDTYVFTHKNNGITSYEGEVLPTFPEINDEFKKNINVDWKDDKSITLTIQKVKGDGSNTALTKGLYGQTYEVNIFGQTTKTEFTFADYQAPTGVTSNIFGDSYCGTDPNGLGTLIDKNSFTGNNLSWTITVEDSTSKYVKIDLKKQGFLSALTGQLGFGTAENNSTTLTWALENASDANFTYDDTEGLKNKTELSNTGVTATMIGTLKDTQTEVTKTFNLSLTIKMTDSPTQKVSTATSDITQNGDLTINLTGINLSQDPAQYKFTHVPSNTMRADQTPSIDSSKLELDSSFTNTSTNVQFIIKKIKENNVNKPFATTPPTVQTKGLYGQTFKVESVQSSNPSTPNQLAQPGNYTDAADQPVTVTLATYVAPTDIDQNQFFDEINSSSQQGDGSATGPTFTPIDPGNVTKNQNLPFDYTIKSQYKSQTFIFVNLPTDDIILRSITGYKGFTENPPVNPGQQPDPSTEYTTVSWAFNNKGDQQGNSNFVPLSSTMLYNQNPLTENNPITASLTATITDNLTEEKVSFNIKITFALGTLDDPSITPSQDPNQDASFNGAEGEANTKIRLAIKGQNLPKEINQWNITDDSKPVLRNSKINLDNEQIDNFGGWRIDDISQEGQVVFTTDWSKVVGMQVGFAIKGFENSKTTFTIPSPSFSNTPGKVSLVAGNIEIKIDGTNLSTDPNMYVFEKIDTQSSTPRRNQIKNVKKAGETAGNSNILDPIEYGITIKSEGQENNKGNSIIVTIPKIKSTNENGEETNVSTPQSLISDFYGKQVKVSIKNAKQDSSNTSATFDIPNYSEPTAIKKELLGKVYTGSDKGNLTVNANYTIDVVPEKPSQSEGSTEKKEATNNQKEFAFNVTLNSDKTSNKDVNTSPDATTTIKYIKFDGIKNYNISSTDALISYSNADQEVTISPELSDFLSNFEGLDGFTDSNNTSLKWEINDNTNSGSIASRGKSLIDRATREGNVATTSWLITEEGLKNTSAISDLTTGVTVSLTGTLTDLLTQKSVIFILKINIMQPNQSTGESGGGEVSGGDSSSSSNVDGSNTESGSENGSGNEFNGTSGQTK